MSLIGFRDWLQSHESSAWTRLRNDAALGLKPAPPLAGINSRSTAAPWQIEKLTKKHKHKHKKHKKHIKEGVDDVMGRQIATIAARADRDGLGDKIEALHAQRKVAGVIASELGIDKLVVTAVRTARKLPGLIKDDGLSGPISDEFKKWVKEKYPQYWWGPPTPPPRSSPRISPTVTTSRLPLPPPPPPRKV